MSTHLRGSRVPFGAFWRQKHFRRSG